MQRYSRLINSVVAFVGALFIQITLHEFAHGFAALALGGEPTVYSGSENHATLSPTREILVALAGPVFSLISGFAVLVLYRSGRGYGYLFGTWFGIVSAQNFFGYLMTGPFVPYGDIGYALRLASAPVFVYILVFIVGVAGTVLLGYILTARLLTLTDNTIGDRAAQLRQLAFFTWVCGAGLALLLSVGSDLLSSYGVFEALAIIAAGLPATMARFFMGRLNVEGKGFDGGLPWVGIALLAAITILRLTVLTQGVSL